MTGLEIFRDVPVLTEENYRQVITYEGKEKKAFFDDLKDCVEVLKKKYKGIVTGLWYCMELDMDGGTYIIFRTIEDITESILNKLDSDITDFTICAFSYRITKNDIEDIEELPIDEWKEFNYIYALYDTERGIAC